MRFQQPTSSSIPSLCRTGLFLNKEFVIVNPPTCNLCQKSSFNSCCDPWHSRQLSSVLSFLLFFSLVLSLLDKERSFSMCVSNCCGEEESKVNSKGNKRRLVASPAAGNTGESSMKEQPRALVQPQKLPRLCFTRAYKELL